MGDTISTEEFDQLLNSFTLQSSSPDQKYAIRFETKGACLVLVIEGMVLQNVPDEFAARLHQLCGHEQARQIIIDLSRVSYISSAIMGFLHQFFVVATNANGRLVIVRPPDKVRKMMVLVGLYEYFVVLDTLEMALEYHKNLAREMRGETMPPASGLR